MNATCMDISLNLSLMIGLLLISRMINQFKFISSSRLSRWTKKTGIPVFFVHLLSREELINLN